MTRDEVERLLTEYASAAVSSGDVELDAVRAAIFLEDAFGIVLTDGEIIPARLGTPEAMAALLHEKVAPS